MFIFNSHLTLTKQTMRDVFLIIHFIGLTMALGTGFANLFLGIAASKLEPAERGRFMANTMILVRMGQTGLGLLLLSGFYLINPYWSTLPSLPTLIAKLSLVVLLIIMVTLISLQVRKAKKENNPALLLKIKPLGIINFFIGITIVVLAVATFH
jgi:hypothetical protein